MLIHTYCCFDKIRMQGEYDDVIDFSDDDLQFWAWVRLQEVTDSLSTWWHAGAMSKGPSLADSQRKLTQPNLPHVINITIHCKHMMACFDTDAMWPTAKIPDSMKTDTYRQRIRQYPIDSISNFTQECIAYSYAITTNSHWVCLPRNYWILINNDWKGK